MQTVDILPNHGYGYRLLHSCSLWPCIFVHSIYIFWSNGAIYICTSNGPEVVDLVMDRMCGDESRHAVRTLYSDLIDDNEIRHPNHYCWSILLSLLNVMAIMEFSSPLISWQHHMWPLLLSPALHQYMKALCFVMEAEQIDCPMLKRFVSSAVQICRCFNVSPHSTYAIDCPNEQVLKGVPSLDSMRWDYWCHHGDTFGIPNISKPEVSQVVLVWIFYATNFIYAGILFLSALGARGGRDHHL